MATSGAFTNPFEAREHLRHIVYGGPAPAPKDDAPKGDARAQRRIAASKSRITPGALGRLATANANLKELRQASLPQE